MHNKSSNLKWILNVLKNYPGSYILHYNRYYEPWVIVEYPKGTESTGLDNEVVNKLVELSVLTPVLTTEEYKVQYALGVVKAREFRLNSSTNIEMLAENYHDI